MGAHRTRFQLTVAAFALLLVSPTVAVRAEEPIRYTYEVRGRENVGDLEEFAARAAETYADPRGWSQGGSIVFERVESGGDFTLWLAAPQTLTEFAADCSANYSCRVGRDVVINEVRFAEATPSWWGGGASLRDYQHMVVNHETGHWLGLDHTTCTAAGTPAPLMQQQSKDLQGCIANAWPLAAELGQVRAFAPAPAAPAEPAAQTAEPTPQAAPAPAEAPAPEIEQNRTIAVRQPIGMSGRVTLAGIWRVSGTANAAG